MSKKARKAARKHTYSLVAPHTESDNAVTLRMIARLLHALADQLQRLANDQDR